MNSISNAALESKQELSGKTALLTGGTNGIGRETVFELANLGAHVIFSGRDAQRGEEVVSKIREQGGQADFVALDMKGGADAKALAQKALKLGGGHVDILINNVAYKFTGPTSQSPEAEFDMTYAVNVKVPYFLVAELAPLMAERGHGSIINISTMVADYGVAGMSIYASSKAALELLTKSWAAEFGPKGVRVNAVAPGPTRTERQAEGHLIKVLAAQAPAGRPGTMREIADAITYLATDRSSFVQGIVLHVDGGRTAV
jgi:NAD(P)-dependent dehydrogenase (short-subunit alcohol dehydrogenase family)